MEKTVGWISREDENLDTIEVQHQFLRLILAAYLLGQMMNTDAKTTPDETAKERKVRAAYEYADLLMKG